MEDMRRKLDMAEGSKSALQTQVRVFVDNTGSDIYTSQPLYNTIVGVHSINRVS